MRNLRIAGGLCVLLAAVVLVWSTVSTSSARVAATTETTSVFGAGTLTLDTAASHADLFFDADGLYPGLEIEGCIEILYDGSIPASLRLHSNVQGGTGLEDYIGLQLERSAFDGTCDNFVADGPPIFNANLSELWARHSNYGTGQVLAADVSAGSRLALRATVEMVDDNAAQDLSTDFWITVEVRP